MQPIQFDATCYRAGEQPIYLLSGEFHYFRVPRADWQRRMRLFKEAGGNCLATYIPWLIHEPEEGRFAFSGEDWLDLEGFLQAAQQEGLYVIARPGPYQYSELVYNGLPGWLVQRYPEVMALDAAGKPIGYASISYTHPVFLEKVQRWFDAVCPILARYTLSRGGPIAFTQIDNEMVGVHEWFGSLDYHPTSMGFGQPGGAFPRFLELRYHGVEALNQAWDASYADFLAARPVAAAAQSPAAAIRQRKDYFDFYLSTVADYSARLVEMLRAHGIDTPIVHNSANPNMNAYFEPVVRRLGSDFLLGSDHYYNLDQDWPQNHPTPQYAACCFLSLEMLRLMGYPPSVFELPGGSCSDWPPVTPGDALAAYMTNLAFGMKGSNYYIFTGGPNPPGAGTTTDVYDFLAGIGADGEIRPLYYAQKQFGQFIQQHPGWLTAARRADFRLALDLEYDRARQYWEERGPFLFSNEDAEKFLRKGLLTTALCASLSPECVDLSADGWASDTRTPLVVASSVSMAAAKQQRLVDFLQRGGRLVIAPLLPRYDEALQPCMLLADFLGDPLQVSNSAGISRPAVEGVINVNADTFPFARLPDGSRVTGMDEFSDQPISVVIDTPGGGKACVLGFHWKHAMHEHERMLRAVLSGMGLEQAVECDNPNLWTALYVEDHHATLFALNLFTAPFEAQIRFRPAPGAGWVDAGRVAVGPVSVKVVEVDL